MARTVSRWIRFLVDDSGATPREIPVDKIGAVGFTYDTEDLTAFQDAIKGYLANHPDATIEIEGPFDTSDAVAASATTVKPALSGSHTVLAPVSAPTFTTPLGLAVMFGMQHYWAAGEPVFGVVAPSATEGYICTEYTVQEGVKYKASFKPVPGCTPAWGTAILT